MNLASVLELAAQRYPEAEALITPEATYTYIEWNNRVNSAAWGLLAANIRQGDRVAICATNGEAPATIYFASHKIGATAVFLNARWKSEELSYAIRDANVKAIFYDLTTKNEITLALDQCETEAICIEEGVKTNCDKNIISYANLVSHPIDYAPVIIRDDMSLATILYTSGTTGRPKGVCRTCRSDYLASLAIIIGQRWSCFERILGVMPLYHTMGIHSLISTVLLNGACILLPKVEPSECLNYIESNQVTALYLVPTIFYDLIQYIKTTSKTPPHVSKLAFAGAPMHVSLVKECYTYFSPDFFVNQYGCTEMLAITFNPNLQQKPTSAGRPALHTRLRIVMPTREHRVLPREVVNQGETGEIIVDTGPQAFQGYLNNEDAMKKSIQEGWYYTGDLGFLDQEGDLHLVGRSDDIIISGGENIYPKEVEDCLKTHPLVKEAAVVGMPHVRWGETVAAFIVTGPGQVNSNELDRFCIESQLARYKRPRKYFFIDKLPKSPAGKILYSQLKNT